MDNIARDISPHFKGTTPEEVRIAQRLVDLEGTPEAIREFTRCRTKLTDYYYWFLLGTLWVNYTGFSDLQLWKKLFSAERPDRDECLMKPSEIRALDSLPYGIRVFRAHRPGETDWIAYTLDIKIAANMALHRGVREFKAYRVQRPDVLALFLRRGEAEILVLDKSKPQYESTVKIEHDTLMLPGEYRVKEEKEMNVPQTEPTHE